MSVAGNQFAADQFGPAAKAAAVRFALLNGVLFCSAAIAALGTPAGENPAQVPACQPAGGASMTARRPAAEPGRPTPCGNENTTDGYHIGGVQ